MCFCFFPFFMCFYFFRWVSSLPTTLLLSRFLPLVPALACVGGLCPQISVSRLHRGTRRLSLAFGPGFFFLCGDQDRETLRFIVSFFLQCKWSGNGTSRGRDEYGPGRVVCVICLPCPPIHVSHAPTSCRALWGRRKKRRGRKRKSRGGRRVCVCVCACVCQGLSSTIDRFARFPCCCHRRLPLCLGEWWAHVHVGPQPRHELRVDGC